MTTLKKRKNITSNLIDSKKKCIETTNESILEINVDSFEIAKKVCSDLVSGISKVIPLSFYNFAFFRFQVSKLIHDFPTLKWLDFLKYLPFPDIWCSNLNKTHINLTLCRWFRTKQFFNSSVSRAAMKAKDRQSLFFCLEFDFAIDLTIISDFCKDPWIFPMEIISNRLLELKPSGMFSEYVSFSTFQIVMDTIVEYDNIELFKHYFSLEQKAKLSVEIKNGGFGGSGGLVNILIIAIKQNAVRCVEHALNHEFYDKQTYSKAFKTAIDYSNKDMFRVVARFVKKFLGNDFISQKLKNNIIRYGIQRDSSMLETFSNPIFYTNALNDALEADNKYVVSIILESKPDSTVDFRLVKTLNMFTFLQNNYRKLMEFSRTQKDGCYFIYKDIPFELLEFLIDSNNDIPWESLSSRNFKLACIIGFDCTRIDYLKFTSRRFYDAFSCRVGKQSDIKSYYLRNSKQIGIIDLCIVELIARSIEKKIGNSAYSSPKSVVYIRKIFEETPELLNILRMTHMRKERNDAIFNGSFENLKFV